MLKQISPCLLFIVLCSIGCDDSASGGPDAPQDAFIQMVDGGEVDGTPTDADSTPNDLGLTPVDVIAADIGTPDECLEDNGGCGDALYWRCADRPDEPPTCTLIANDDYSALTEGVESSGVVPPRQSCGPWTQCIPSRRR